MKKSTIILLVLYVLVLIPSIIMGKYIFSAIVPTGTSFTFNFNTNAIIALVLNVVSLILGLILFFRFISSLSVHKAIFFSSLPIFIFYGVIIFLLAQLPTFEGEVSQSASALLNITKGSNFNVILWAIVVTFIFMFQLFINFFILCRPVGRVEQIVSRLSDGRIKEERLTVGGIKQFHNIEHSLNKINSNYKRNDKSFKEYKLETEKYIPKQFFKFLGKNSIAELELGRQVKKSATTVLIKLIGVNNTAKMSLEENFHFVNSYVNVISPLVRRFGGFIDKYLGEGLLVVFASCEDALNCVHTICRAIGIKNRQNKQLPNVLPRISMLNGEVIFGVIGEEERKMPTIVSDVYAKLEKLDEIAKMIGGSVVFSKTLLDNLPFQYRFLYRFIGNVTLSQNESNMIFEDLDVYHKDKVKEILKTKNIFEKGVMHYSNGDYEKAYSYLEEVLKENGADKCAYLYFNKCKDKLG
ncbi:MAG: hypothetical protein E7379_02120 [Clostridiales bacterium]|nr:hypothetical protein [Clostridiales bacterium]